MQLLQMFHNSRPQSPVESWLNSAGRWWFLIWASVAFSSLAACAQPEDGSRSARRAIAQSQAIATDFLSTELALSPETASRLGLERQLGPTASFALDNHSQAGFERRRLVRIELLQRLYGRPFLPDGHPLARDLEICTRALQDLTALEQLGYGRFDYAALRPYAIDPFSGIWIEGPTLLVFRQAINSADEAAAYLTRLRSLSQAIQDTRRRLIADHATGLVLPRPLVMETRDRIEQLLADDHAALRRITETFRVLTLVVDDLDPEQRQQLMALVARETEIALVPAYRELSDTLNDLLPESSDQVGVWARPKGQALYSGVLTAALGETPTLERLHARNLDRVAAAQEAIRAEMVVPSELEGDVPARPTAFADELAWYQQIQPDAAPAELVELASDVDIEIDTIRELSPQSVWQRWLGENPAEIDAISVRAFEAQFSNPPFQTWRQDDDGLLPPHRILVPYPAISAAWAHVAWAWRPTGATAHERIAMRRIGLIRAVLAAADTGLHLDRWTLDEAEAYIALEAGLPQPLAREVSLTLLARPGYHTAVVTASARLEALAERAQAVLGDQFDSTGFLKAMYQPGPRPMPLIERDIEAWYGARLKTDGAD